MNAMTILSCLIAALLGAATMNALVQTFGVTGFVLGIPVCLAIGYTANKVTE